MGKIIKTYMPLKSSNKAPYKFETKITYTLSIFDDNR